MGHLKQITPLILTAAFFCLVFPPTASAAGGQGHSLTMPQLLMLGLIMVWYIYNHFKERIKAFFKKNDER